MLTSQDILLISLYDIKWRITFEYDIPSKLLVRNVKCNKQKLEESNAVKWTANEGDVEQEEKIVKVMFLKWK